MPPLLVPVPEQDINAGYEIMVAGENDPKCYHEHRPKGPVEVKAGQRPEGIVEEESPCGSPVNAPALCRTDETIAQDWIWRGLQKVVGWYGQFMHSYTITGHQRLPKTGPYLVVGLHSSHNTDIPIGMLYQQQVTGRVVRCLLHYSANWPFVKDLFWRLGCVAGNRSVAQAILGEGHCGACIPGGLEEAFLHTTRNGAQAYTLRWESYNGNRKIGFAHVALGMGPGFTVFPCFNENCEEMRFNPIYELWSFLRLDSAYGALLRAMPKPVRSVMWHVAFMAWILVCPLSLPVPVKVTGHIGEGVRVEAGDTPEALSARVRAQFDALLDSTLGKGRRHRCYATGLLQRYRFLFPATATATASGPGLATTNLKTE